MIAKHITAAYIMAKLTRLALMYACLAAVVAGLLSAAAIPAVGVLILLVVACRALRRPLPVTGAYGIARFADVVDLVIAQMLYARLGVLVGRLGGARLPSRRERLKALFFWPDAWSIQACLLAFADTRKIRRAFVRIPDFCHGLIVAPPGRGKSRCIAISVLLDYAGPVFVLDIKGELFLTAAGHRVRRSGRRVILIDPFRITGYPIDATDAVNPLDLIDCGSPTALDDCRFLAASMVQVTGDEKDPHWSESARVFITAAIAFVSAYASPDERNLQSVRSILCDPKAFAAAIKQMQESTAYGGLLRRYGHRLTQYIDRELGSALTTTNRFMDYLDSVLVAAATAKTTFRFEDVVAGRADMYVCIPPEQLIPQANFLRLITTCMYLAQIRHGTERTPVLYLLDEIGNLGGGLEAVERALTIGRGYGARILMFVQSLGQIKSVFPKKEDIILSCLDTQLYFGINDYETANLVSKRLGSTTVHAANSGKSGGWSRSYSNDARGGGGGSSGGWSSGVSETGQALLTPDEITRIPNGQAILFHRNHPPALIELAPHDQSPELWGNAREAGPQSWVVMLARAVTLAFLATALVLMMAETLQETKGRAPVHPMPMKVKGGRS